MRVFLSNYGQWRKCKREHLSDCSSKVLLTHNLIDKIPAISIFSRISVKSNKIVSPKFVQCYLWVRNRWNLTYISSFVWQATNLWFDLNTLYFLYFSFKLIKGSTHNSDRNLLKVYHVIFFWKWKWIYVMAACSTKTCGNVQ